MRQGSSVGFGAGYGRSSMAVFGTVGLAVTLLGCFGCGRAGELDAAQVRTEVRAAFEAFQAALASGDLETASAFYSDDGDFEWVEDGALVYRSSDQVRGALEQVSGFGSVEFDFGEASIVALGSDHAALSAPVTTRIRPPEGRGFEFTVMQTIVLRREPAGWRFLRGHSSSANASPPPGGWPS